MSGWVQSYNINNQMQGCRLKSNLAAGKKNERATHSWAALRHQNIKMNGLTVYLDFLCANQLFALGQFQCINAIGEIAQVNGI